MRMNDYQGETYEDFMAYMGTQPKHLSTQIIVQREVTRKHVFCGVFTSFAHSHPSGQRQSTRSASDRVWRHECGEEWKPLHGIFPIRILTSHMSTVSPTLLRDLHQQLWNQVYRLAVRNKNRQTWEAHKRYSEFEALHAAVGKNTSATLPGSLCSVHCEG